jgi:Leucine-rich repeat (LRR) protein
LSGNQFTDVNQMPELLNLEEIHLNENKLQTITLSTFSQLKNLIVINLSSNLIKSINKRAFQHMQSLESLDLTMNKIAFIYKDQLKQLCFNTECTVYYE